jgi:hypothetical protein
MIKILLPVFNINTRWYFGDVEEYKKAVIRIEGNDSILRSKIDNCQGFCSGSLAWVDDIAEVNTILHELSHMVHYILEAVGVDDEETRAYCTGYLGEKLFKAIDKKLRTKAQETETCVKECKKGETNGKSKD